MTRCRLCVIPDTRPDTAFVNGICSACIAYSARPHINWEQRARELTELLDRFHGECIVPSSGGKDSTYQVIRLLDLGASVTVVTASTCHLTPIGRANIENLKRYAKTVEFSPNTSVRAKLNRAGLQMVGDISWPEHVAIFTVPFMAALALGRPLIIYGENPQNQYGGPLDSQHAQQMTRRWVHEFGGFLGLRPADMVGVDGITEKQMAEYAMPKESELIDEGVEAHFLGQYVPWDSHLNAKVALQHGMRAEKPSPANLWDHENLDNAQTGIHDQAMFRKYGYGRGAAQASVDVRAGRLSRLDALRWVEENDGGFAYQYAGVRIEAVLERIGMPLDELHKTLCGFTNWDIFVKRDYRYPPLLKEWER